MEGEKGLLCKGEKSRAHCEMSLQCLKKGGGERGFKSCYCCHAAVSYKSHVALSLHLIEGGKVDLLKAQLRGEKHRLHPSKELKCEPQAGRNHESGFKNKNPKVFILNLDLNSRFSAFRNRFQPAPLPSQLSSAITRAKHRHFQKQKAGIAQVMASLHKPGIEEKHQLSQELAALQDPHRPDTPPRWPLQRHLPQGQANVLADVATQGTEQWRVSSQSGFWGQPGP